MSDIRQAQKALVKRILEGAGQASNADRQAAFNLSGLAEPLRGLLDKAAHSPYKVTDEDINSASVAGLSEDQLLELIVCAAVGQATRQHEAALAALEAAVAEE